MEQQSVFGAQRIYISKRSAIFRQFIFKSNRQAPAAFAAIAFISGVSAAVIITSATMLFGITGILQALALFLPHFIFYVFGYWALYELAYKRSEFRLGEQIGILFRIALWRFLFEKEGLQNISKHAKIQSWKRQRLFCCTRVQKGMVTQ